MFGIGASLAYYPAISAPSHYFSKQRGLATGLAVSGVGVSGLILAPSVSQEYLTLGIRFDSIRFFRVRIVVQFDSTRFFRIRIVLSFDSIRLLFDSIDSIRLLLDFNKVE